MRALTSMLLGVLASGCPTGEDDHASTCDPPRGATSAWFADVTARTGVRFEYSSNGFQGGGLAVIDLTGDGLPDVVAGRRDGGLAVFENRSALAFEERTNGGLDASAAATAFGAADLDNDGDTDLVVAGANDARIMENVGDGTFVEGMRLAGVGTTAHVLPVDLDGDGLLDLHFSNYDVTVGDRSLNRIFLNRGGLQFAATGYVGAGLSWTATALDIDLDGDQDLYVANDTLLPDAGKPPVEAPLWPVDMFLRNDGIGGDGQPSFTDIAGAIGLADPRSSMGGSLADFDDDGTLDLYVPNFGANKVFSGDLVGGFVDRAAELGLAALARANERCGPDAEAPGCLLLSWSALVGDFDLDGYDELLITNGESSPSDPPPVQLFTRGEQLPFHELSPAIPCMDARGAAVADLDGDGDQDLVIAQKDGPLLIYENRGRPAAGGWLRVVLRGTVSNRDGIGAVVTVTLASGRTLVRAVGSGGVVHTASASEAFFGIGTDVVETMSVRWPSGRISTLAAPALGNLIVEEP